MHATTIRGGLNIIEYISSVLQVADLLTKGLGESQFVILRDLLMGY